MFVCSWGILVSGIGSGASGTSSSCFQFSSFSSIFFSSSSGFLISLSWLHSVPFSHGSSFRYLYSVIGPGIDLDCMNIFGFSSLFCDSISTVCTLGPYGRTFGSVDSIVSSVGFSVFSIVSIVGLSGGFLRRASSSTFAFRTFACPADCQL